MAVEGESYLSFRTSALEWCDSVQKCSSVRKRMRRGLPRPSEVQQVERDGQKTIFGRDDQGYGRIYAVGDCNMIQDLPPIPKIASAAGRGPNA